MGVISVFLLFFVATSLFAIFVLALVPSVEVCVERYTTFDTVTYQPFVVPLWIRVASCMLVGK